MTLAGLYMRLRFGMLVGQVRQALLITDDLSEWGLTYNGLCVRIGEPTKFLEKVQERGPWGIEDLEKVRRMVLADLLERESGA